MSKFACQEENRIRIALWRFSWKLESRVRGEGVFGTAFGTRIKFISPIELTKSIANSIDWVGKFVFFYVATLTYSLIGIY